MKCAVCDKEFELKEGSKRKTCCSHCAWKLGKITKKTRRKKKKRVTSYRGVFHGVKCDSRWELAVLIYCLDHKMKIKRCEKVFSYMVRGKEHKYYPDFIIGQKVIEVKGKFRKNLKAKLCSVKEAGFDVWLIDKETIQPYLEYCYNKYKTERLEKLYD